MTRQQLQACNLETTYVSLVRSIGGYYKGRLKGVGRKYARVMFENGAVIKV